MSRQDGSHCVSNSTLAIRHQKHICFIYDDKGGALEEVVQLSGGKQLQEFLRAVLVFERNPGSKTLQFKPWIPMSLYKTSYSKNMTNRQKGANLCLPGPLSNETPKAFQEKQSKHPQCSSGRICIRHSPVPCNAKRCC